MELDSQENPGETKSSEVELDSQENPGETKSWEVEPGSNSRMVCLAAKLLLGHCLCDFAPHSCGNSNTRSTEVNCGGQSPKTVSKVPQLLKRKESRSGIEPIKKSERQNSWQ